MSTLNAIVVCIYICFNHINYCPTFVWIITDQNAGQWSVSASKWTISSPPLSLVNFTLETVSMDIAKENYAY